MRDVIWTLIVIWLVYKLVDIFRSTSKRPLANNNQASQDHTSSQRSTFSAKKGPKDVIQKSADKEGDYIDFEEIK